MSQPTPASLLIRTNKPMRYMIRAAAIGANESCRTWVLDAICAKLKRQGYQPPPLEHYTYNAKLTANIDKIAAYRRAGKMPPPPGRPRRQK